MGHRYEIAALASDALLFNRNVGKHLAELDEIRDEVDAKILDIFSLRRRLQRYEKHKIHGKMVKELLHCWRSLRSEERSKRSRSASRSREDSPSRARSSKSKNKEDSTSKSSRSRNREDVSFRARSSKSTTSGRDAYNRGNRDRCPPRRSPRRSTRSPSRNWTRRSPLRRQPYNSDFPEVISSTTVSSSISLREHPLKTESKPVPYSYKIPEKGTLRKWQPSANGLTYTSNFTWKTPEKTEEKEEVEEKVTERILILEVPHTEDKPAEPVEESSKGLSEFEWRQVFACVESVSHKQSQDTVITSPVSPSLAPFELPRHALPVARIGPPRPVEKLPMVSKEPPAFSSAQVTKPTVDARQTRSAVFNGAVPPGCLEKPKEAAKIKIKMNADPRRPLHLSEAPFSFVAGPKEKAAPKEESRTSESPSLRQTRSSVASESVKHPEDPVPKVESGSLPSVPKEPMRIKIPIKPKVPPLPKPKVATPIRATATVVSPTVPTTKTVIPRGAKLSSSTISTRQTRSSTSNALLQQQTAIKIEEGQGTPSAPAKEAKPKLPVKLKTVLPLFSPSNGNSLPLATVDVQKSRGIVARPAISPMFTGTKPSAPPAPTLKPISTAAESQKFCGFPERVEKNVGSSVTLTKVEAEKAPVPVLVAAPVAPTARSPFEEAKKPQEVNKSGSSSRVPSATRITIPIAPKVVKNWNKSANVMSSLATTTAQPPFPLLLSTARRRKREHSPPPMSPIKKPPSPSPTADVIPVRPQETPSAKSMETKQQTMYSLDENEDLEMDSEKQLIVKEEVQKEEHESDGEPWETTSCETAVNVEEMQMVKKPDPVSIDPPSSANDVGSKLKLCTGVPNMRIPKRSRPVAFVPRLFELCEKAAEKYARGAFHGRVPFSLLRPLLNKYDARKLFEVEITMPWLEDSITIIWKERLEKEFPSATLYPSESYGEAYRRCLEEKEEELEEQLIKAAMDVKKKTPKQVEVKRPQKRRAPRGPSGENRSTRAKRAAKRA